MPIPVKERLVCYNDNTLRYTSVTDTEEEREYEYGPYDGWYNNRAHPDWGGAGEIYGHLIYRQTSNISSTLVGNKFVENSDVVGASPVGAAPTISSFST